MSQSPAQGSTKTSECNGYNFAVEILKGGSVIFRAEFSVITDVGSLTLMSIINVVKLLYPDAEIRTYVCKDEPIFATPFFSTVMRSYMLDHVAGNKFG